MKLIKNEAVSQENKIGLAISLLLPSEIRKYDKEYGGNLPCFCGSGRKFKKCHETMYKRLTKNRR